MIAASVLRKQYPVGHGGFHAGRILVRTDAVPIPNAMLLEAKNADGSAAQRTLLEKFYVYDCGSESPEAFDRSLRNHNRLTDTRTDILFVSHLDSDHVNKIERLMGANPPKIVVLPYLDFEDLAVLLLRDVDSGKATSSVREYVQDPLNWWLRRGVPPTSCVATAVRWWALRVIRSAPPIFPPFCCRRRAPVLASSGLPMPAPMPWSRPSRRPSSV